MNNATCIGNHQPKGFQCKSPQALFILRIKREVVSNTFTRLHEMKPYLGMAPNLRIVEATGQNASSHAQAKLCKQVSSLVIRNRRPLEKPGLEQLHPAEVRFAQVGAFKSRQFQVGLAQTAAFKNRLLKTASRKPQPESSASEKLSC